MKEPSVAGGGGSAATPEAPLIWLVRHGRPLFDDQRPIRGRDFADWVAGYDDAALDPDVLPSEKLCALARSAGCIATSTLRRSMESARVLDPTHSLLSDSNFREAEVPGLPFPMSWGPLRWATLARLAWCAGWSPGVETLGQARARARLGAERLDRLASEHGSVMLVAHGIINGFIATALRARGWSGPRAYGGDYWAHSRFEK